MVAPLAELGHAGDALGGGPAEFVLAELLDRAEELAELLDQVERSGAELAQ